MTSNETEKESGLLGPPTPWDSSPMRLEQWLTREAPHDAIQLWILKQDQPRADELLLCRGFSDQTIASWISGAHRSDTIFQRAGEEGGVQGVLSDTGMHNGVLPPEARVMAHMQMESLAHGRAWYILAARRGEPFTTREQEIMASSLRLWQASFNRPAEAGMARMVVGSDHRLLHADPACRLLLLHHGVSFQQLIGWIHEIHEQRWPGATDEAPHDFAIELGDEVYWVVIRRTKSVELPGSHNWRLELRPLEPNELVPVGHLADERIALALAYIHDRCNESPSLTSIARHVHVSPFHFHRLFTRQVGVSPKQYLQMKQLQVARWRLRSQRVPIGRIAKEAGFRSHGHFTATFRRVVGASPTAYRNRST